MTYGVLLLVLAIFKASACYKLNGLQGSRLGLVLIRDQAMYFILFVLTFSSPPVTYPNYDDLSDSRSTFRAIFVAILSMLGDRIDSTTAVESLVAGIGSTTFLSILGSRMFFNLKEAAERGVNVGTNWSEYEHSAIRFGGPLNGDVAVDSEANPRGES